MVNKHPAPEARPHPSMAPVILANLTDQDHDRFHAAHIGYSGATGKGRMQGYEPYGPYIATFWGELEQALAVLQWTRAEIHVEAGPQYIVRRGAVPSVARPPQDWGQCSHTFVEVDGDTAEGFTAVRCSQCQCPGERNDKTGDVFWPAT